MANTPLSKADARFRAWSIVKADYELNGRPNATFANPEFKASVDLEAARLVKSSAAATPAKLPKGYQDYEAAKAEARTSGILSFNQVKWEADQLISGTKESPITFQRAVRNALEGVPEVSFEDLLTQVAIEYNRVDTDISWSVRMTLEYLEYKNEIKNKKDPGAEAVMVNGSYYKGWKIINLGYKAPTEREKLNLSPTASEVGAEFFTKKTSKSGLFDMPTEMAVADMLKYASLDQRSRMFIRAVESAKKRIAI